jgi:hypothetical protein
MAAPAAHQSARAPLWNVSGRWDGSNGAEYAVFRQGKRGALDITIHHTCAPGHIERGQGRVSGDRVTGRVTPASEPTPACVRFATIDVRVDPSGRRLTGRFATDVSAGPLLYLAAKRARSLVRFRPRIVRSRRSDGGHDVRVLLRPRPKLPRRSMASVSLCRRGFCSVRSGRYGPRFKQSRHRCALFVARISFAGSSASSRRSTCVGPR